MKKNTVLIAALVLFVAMSAFKCGGNTGGGTGGTSQDTVSVHPK